MLGNQTKKTLAFEQFYRRDDFTRLTRCTGWGRVRATKRKKKQEYCQLAVRRDIGQKTAVYINRMVKTHVISPCDVKVNWEN